MPHVPRPTLLLSVGTWHWVSPELLRRVVTSLSSEMESLKAQTATFQKRVHEVKVVARRKNNRICRVICAVVLFAGVGVAMPYIIQVWLMMQACVKPCTQAAMTSLTVQVTVARNLPA